MLWVLFATLALVAQSQAENCTLKYYTVNTFETKNNFSFSCYGIGADCEIYYAPPGTGCNGAYDSLIGTVPENKTLISDGDFDFSGNIELSIDFKLSGGFCSNNQIGVSYGFQFDEIKHLPRATDAGTKFHIPFSDKTIQQNPCAVFALSSPAQVNISINGTSTESLNIGRFESIKLALGDVNNYETVTKIDSDNPVIVSCIEKFTFQPISSEPLLIVPKINDTVSVAISDCSTNELITNFSKVNVTFAPYQNKAKCGYTDSVSSTVIQVFNFNSSDCYFFIEPLDNVCVSILAVSKSSKLPYVVGLPESKFSTRFVTSGDVDDTRLFSLSSDTTCAVFDNISEPVTPPISLEISDSSNVSFASGPVTFSLMKCDNPILMIVDEPVYLIPFLSGNEAEEMWQPWFDSYLQCPDDPTDVPTYAPFDSSPVYPPRNVPISPIPPPWSTPVALGVLVVAAAVVIALLVYFCKTRSNKETKSEDDEIVYAEQVVGPEDNQFNPEEPYKSKDAGIVYAEELVGPEDNQLNQNESKHSYRL